MNQQGIDRIAQAVVASLAGSPGPGLLGCSSISSQVAFSADEQWACHEYGCGGQGLFGCCQGFVCFADFACPESAPYVCSSSAEFSCLIQFECGQQFSTQPCR